MSKKTLLSESQIRRFMKLASVEPLTNPFIDTRRSLGEQLDDGMIEDEDADPVGADPLADPAVDAAALDVGGEASPAGPGDFDVEGLVVAIVDAIQGHPEVQQSGVQLSVSGEEGEAEAGMPDLSDVGDEEAPMELDAEGPDMLEDPAKKDAAGVYENKLRAYVRDQIAQLLEAHKHIAGGEDMLSKGGNSEEGSSPDDNQKSSAGEHHFGGGKAKASQTHMGSHPGSALPLEESVLDNLTRRVAARLLDITKK